MSLWVKICGNTSIRDAQMAADARADAVGFVFAPSPRRVTPAQVAGIVAELPDSIEKIGVFVDAQLEEIASAVEQCGLTGVQLHSECAPSLTFRLRERFGPGLRLLRVIHFETGASHKLAMLKAEPAVDAVLVDTRTAGKVGGTGVRFDWNEARRSIFLVDRGLKLIAAGGLAPGNVAEAIATLAPWGVDVASGVEAAPGSKDAGKVREFVANARAAFDAFRLSSSHNVAE